jgi:hypothetical protein
MTLVSPWPLKSTIAILGVGDDRDMAKGAMAMVERPTGSRSRDSQKPGVRT